MKDKKRTKTVKTPSGRDFTYETNKEIDAADAAVEAAQKKYFEDKPKPQKKKCGGKVHKMKKGGAVRGDGCCVKGKTKGRMC